MPAATITLIYANARQILTHIRCHMDDARIAVQTGVDGVYAILPLAILLLKSS